MALAGGVLITDQITDHFAPYYYELRTATINKIIVLSDAYLGSGPVDLGLCSGGREMLYYKFSLFIKFV